MPKPKATAAPPRKPTTIRGSIDRARHLTSTTPEERFARKQAAAAVLQTLHALGPERIRALQASGDLSRDGATMLRQVAGSLQRRRAHQSRAQAERDARDLEIERVAKAATNEDVAELVAAARAGLPEAAQALEEMTGALWRVRSRDPAFVSGMVEAYGPTGAAEVLRAQGVPELIPVATETYISAKAETWAKATQDVAAKDPTGVSQADLPIFRNVSDPAYQATAARTLLRLGLPWGENETPGLALTRHLITVARHGAEPGRHGDKAFTDDELAARLEEMTGGAVGDAHAIKQTIEAVRLADTGATVMQRMKAADLARRKERGLDKPQELTGHAKDEAARRAALEKARAQIGPDGEDDAPREVGSVTAAVLAHARGDNYVPTRTAQAEAERIYQREKGEAERHEHTIQGSIDKARAKLEGRPSPGASGPAPEPSTSPEPSTPATSGGTIRESIAAARAAMPGGSTDAAE